MPDKKITDLTALTTVAEEDLLPIVDDPGGTPATKKITRANLLSSNNIEGVMKFGADANSTDFPYAQAIISQGDTGATASSYNIGLVLEAIDTTREPMALYCFAENNSIANGYSTAIWAMAWGNVSGAGENVAGGFQAYTHGATAAYGVEGIGAVDNTADTGMSCGGYFGATATHAGGTNTAIYAEASGGANNYSFYGAAGTLYNAGNLVCSGDIYTVAYTTWTPTIAVVGGTAPTYATKVARYHQIGKLVFWQLYMYNTSGGTAGAGAITLRVSLPVNAHANNTFIGSGYTRNATTYKNVIVEFYDADEMCFRETADETYIQGIDQNDADNRRIAAWGVYEAA